MMRSNSGQLVGAASQPPKLAECLGNKSATGIKNAATSKKSLRLENITENELDKYVQHLCQRDKLKELFARIDQNDDGNITSGVNIYTWPLHGTCNHSPNGPQTVIQKSQS